MTFIYAGKASELPQADFNTMAKDAISAARWTGSFGLQIQGVEQMGPVDDRVDVLTLHPTPQLLVARKIVEKWDDGQFPVYIPHATIGPEGSAAQSIDPYADPYRKMGSSFSGLPMSLFFTRIAVCWGDRKLIFNLNDF